MEILSENCGYCGCCVVVCPEHVLELEESVLHAKEGCTDCGNCSFICPLGALIPGGPG